MYSVYIYASVVCDIEKAFDVIKVQSLIMV